MLSGDRPGGVFVYRRKYRQLFLDQLPEDNIPYWDLNAPDIPNTEKDASAAAILASALLDLSMQTKKKSLAKKFNTGALAILSSLNSPAYLSDDNQAILKHCVGNKPHNSEVDASLIYADYYFLEAVLKVLKLDRASFDFTANPDL